MPSRTRRDSSGRTIVAYQVSPLGLVDGELVANLQAAGVPFLMGIASSMGALKHLPRRQEFGERWTGAPVDGAANVRGLPAGTF